MTASGLLLQIVLVGSLACGLALALLRAARATHHAKRLQDDLDQANRRITLYRTDVTQLRMFINARFNSEDEPRADN